MISRRQIIESQPELELAGDGMRAFAGGGDGRNQYVNQTKQQAKASSRRKMLLKQQADLDQRNALAKRSTPARIKKKQEFEFDFDQEDDDDDEDEDDDDDFDDHQDEPRGSYEDDKLEEGEDELMTMKQSHTSQSHAFKQRHHQATAKPGQYEAASGEQAAAICSSRQFDPYSVYGEEDEEEDVWYSEERLFEDHLQEIVDKWLAIDDEIWAKIICMERNRRIAKAYARKHQLTVNGSEDEYLDGTTLGLNSFDNPDMDSKTRHIKQYIGQGLRIKITKGGDILVKRLSEANVFVHRPSSVKRSQAAAAAAAALNKTSSERFANEMHADYSKSSNSSSDPYTSEFGDFYGVARPQYAQCNNSTATGRYLTGGNKINRFTRSLASGGGGGGGSSKLSSYAHQARGGASSSSATRGPLTTALGANYKSVCLEQNKAVKIFDMSRFKLLLEHEARQARPDRNYLQNQCISVISFVVDDKKLLNLPSWIMIINIVALDLFREELGFDDYEFAPSRADLLLGSGLVAPSYNLDFHASERVDVAQVDDGDYDYDDFENDADGGAGRWRADRSGFVASKRAFAQAAAKGAYNGDHYSDGSDGHNNIADKQSSSSFMMQQKQQQQHQAKRHGSESNLRDKSNFEIRKEKMLANSSDIVVATQQSSSSSGFNSHCSSQHDSSAASSNSNIASSPNQLPANETPAERQQASSVLQAVRNLENGAQEVGKQQQQQQPARGKRPPKLPHRLAPAPVAEPASMSAPIEIPAPPSEPTSGTANLILVSPTGLSPPNRREAPAKQPLMNYANAGEHLEFRTIKHVDEEGKCKLLFPGSGDQSAAALGLRKPPVPPQRAARLPAGIPAHAQLAPPATQRHILRYLMSVSQGRLTEPRPPGGRLPVAAMPGSSDAASSGGMIYDVRAGGPPATAKQPDGSTRNQRPLPILPDQQRRNQQQQQQAATSRQQVDEGLYYSGLQARISSTRGRAFLASSQQQQLASRANMMMMNPVLKEFRQNAAASRAGGNGGSTFANPSGVGIGRHPRLQPAAQRPAPAYGNSQQPFAGARLARSTLYKSFEDNFNQQLTAGHENDTANTANPLVRPLAKLFKSSWSNGNNNRRQVLPAQQHQQPLSSSHKRSKFSSADNLHHQQQQQHSFAGSKQPSLLNQLGLAINSSFRSKLSRGKSKSSAKL